LLQAAGASYLQINFKRAIEGVTVGDVMSSDCPTISGNLDLQHFVEELLTTGRRCFVVLEQGDVTGLVTPQEVKQVERARWPFTTVHDVMQPLEEMRTVTPETPLTSALEMMGQRDFNQLPVVSGGHLAGVLSRAHLVSFLQNRTELQA
jgi:CBS domain-containing protein